MDIRRVETPFPAYNGDEDFVFICYSHRDAALVYPEIQRLHEADVNIWYDEGIRPGAEWTDELANAIRECKTLLLFATPRSVDSKHCRDEVQYALRHDKAVVIIYLEPTELPPGLDLMLGPLHAIEKGHHDEARHLELILEAIANAPADGGVSRANMRPKAGPPAPDKRRRQMMPMIAVAAALAVFAAGWWGWRQSSAPAEDASPAAFIANTVALLPFEDRGGFERESYYPESLSEDLLNRLVAIDGLKVASRRASFAFDLSQQASTPLTDIAAQLGVGALVVGYIRRSGDQIRFSLELIDVTSGTEIVKWSRSYVDQTMDKMLNIQTDVTRQIAQAFFPEGVSAETEERLAGLSTSSPQAYDFYLQGKELLRRPLDDSSVMQEAIRLFEAALELDADFAWARAGLCNSHRLAYQERTGDFTSVENACEALIGYEQGLFDVRLALGSYYVEIGALDYALVELEAATRLNPQSGDAKLEFAKALADRFNLKKDDLDRVRAEQAFLEAIAVEPRYWFTYHSYATFLTAESRLEEAKTQLGKALELQPSSVASLNNSAGVHYRQGHTEEAADLWLRSLEVSEDNRWAYSGLGILYHYERDYPRAVTYFESGIRVSPEDHLLHGRLGESMRLIPERKNEAVGVFRKAIVLAEQTREINPNSWEVHGFLALYHAYVGEHETARTKLDRMFALNPAEDPMTHYWAALVSYEAGDVDATFRHLDEALAGGFAQQKRFIVDEPALDGLRTAHGPRFDDLMSRY